MKMKFLAAAAVVCAGLCRAECVYSDKVPDEGFKSIYNGKDLSGWCWSGDETAYYVDAEGNLTLDPKRKGAGQLLTDRDYENFILRFEFCMPTNGNNGLGIRCPLGKDAAYWGMCELQLLDDGGSEYYDSAAKKDKLQPYQYTGSIYGIVPSLRDNFDKQIWGKQKNFTGGGSYLRKPGMWNFEEVRVIGSRIQVILNGYMITDADIKDIKGDGTDTPDHKAHPGLHNKTGKLGWLGHGAAVKWRNIRIKEVGPDYKVGACPCLNKAPEGFTQLFNGRDFTNWKGVTTKEKFDNPKVRQAATPEKRAEMQKIADEQMRARWHVRDNAFFFDGFQGGYSLATAKDYKDFEMYVDWRLLSVTGDSGLYLRGSPQVQIWDAHNQWHIGSGGLYNNMKNPSKALSIADNIIGDWNRFRIRMVGEKVSVWLNGVLVVDNVTLENYWDRASPIFPREQIELQCHGDPLEFRNIFIREL